MDDDVMQATSETDAIADGNQAGTGPDWRCQSCTTLNASEQTHCARCGATSAATLAVEARAAQARAAAARPASRASAARRGPSGAEPTRARARALQVVYLSGFGLFAALIGGAISGATTFSRHYGHVTAMGWGTLWCGIAVVIGIALVLVGEGLTARTARGARLRWARLAGILGFGGGIAVMVVERTHFVVSTLGWFTPPLLGAAVYGLALMALSRGRIVARVALGLVCLALGIAAVGGTVSQHDYAGLLSTNPITHVYEHALKAIAPPYTRRPVRIWNTRPLGE